MRGHSELARILMAISNDEELVKNTLSKLAKQFDIKYGENAENEEKDPDHKIKVGLLYDSIITSSPIVVNDGNFRQIIEERFNKGSHLMLYDPIIADSVIDYYELVFEPIAFGEDCYLCLVSPKDNLDARVDNALYRLSLNYSSINNDENEKEIIKRNLSLWKGSNLLDNYYKMAHKPTDWARALKTLFVELNFSNADTKAYFLFIELLLNKKFDNINEREVWRNAFGREKNASFKKSKTAASAKSSNCVAKM